MFFVLAKIFWFVAQPLSIVLLLALGTVVFLIARWRRLAMASAVAGVLVLGLSAFSNLGYMIISPLEDRFAAPAELPANVSAIIVLGGATHARPSTARQTVSLNEAGERLTTALYLAQAYPAVPIILSGGSGLLDETEPEAETMRRFFASYGIGDDRLIAEGESRNTDENSQFTAELIGELEGSALLVTSAFHMPRSVGLFRSQGIDVIAWPTDYRSSGTEVFGLDIANPVHNLIVLTVATKEWIGLFAYSLTGRTSEVFPSPSQ
jgi:uncharacterized SAM-binding protein YcdF (DUF218 family)